LGTQAKVGLRRIHAGRSIPRAMQEIQPDPTGLSNNHLRPLKRRGAGAVNNKLRFFCAAFR